MIREKEIEAKYVKTWKASGALVFKLVCPGFTGVPDRLLLWPGGRAEFAEFKAPGEKPTARQLRVHEKLRSLGFEVKVIDR